MAGFQKLVAASAPNRVWSLKSGKQSPQRLGFGGAPRQACHDMIAKSRTDENKRGERLEDAEDVALLKRARRKKLHFRPLEEVLADLPKR